MKKKPVPWMSFVPDLMASETMPEDDLPYSAAKPLVMTLNSATASTEGLTVSFCAPCEAMDWLLLSMPSIMKLISVPRWPPIEMPWPRETTVPAEITASCR